MKIYNTLSRKIEKFVAIKPPYVGFYACGPTVYDYAHLGHLRKYTMDDVLLKTLEHAGFKVQFVQNITDVGHLTSDQDIGEDKLEKGAKKYGITAWKIAKKFEDYFFYSMDLLGIKRPDVSCRATEHIKAQLELVKKLESKGVTYVIAADGVYFDTSKLVDYGQLTKFDSKKLASETRLVPVKGKRHASDFALWKFERPGENRVMSWPSPWAERSFPGWHIECSAMSMKYLGKQFDIHTGGIDHIAIHHTNEIAQAETATGKKPFVKYWVHHNFLLVDGQKMSKSLNNFFTVDDVLQKNIHPRALRLLFLGAHYRSELNFTWESLRASMTSYAKLINFMVDLNTQLAGVDIDVGAKKNSKLTKINLAKDKYQHDFFTALENDLHAAQALAILWEVVKSNLPILEKNTLLLAFDQILGLGLNQAIQIKATISQQIEIDQLPVEIQRLVVDRQKARQAKNWFKADQIRQRIEQLGYQLEDQSDSQILITSIPSAH